MTSFGADPTGSADSTAAFNSAIGAGRRAAPSGSRAGTFRVNGHIIVNNVTIRGAGMWHSVVTATRTSASTATTRRTPSANVHLSNFAINGNIQERNDGAQVNGIGGALQNSTVSDIWIEHTKVGAWMDGPFTNLMFTGMRIRNQTADAINFHSGVTNSLGDAKPLPQHRRRRPGDVGGDQRQREQQLHFNTVELPHPRQRHRDLRRRGQHASPTIASSTRA